MRAKLQQVFGLIHQTRGQYAAARAALEEALDRAAPARRARTTRQTLESLQALAEVCHYGGDDERAQTAARRIARAARRLYGDRHPQTARVLHAMAPVASGRDIARAGELLRKALEIRRATLGAHHPDVGP